MVMSSIRQKAYIHDMAAAKLYGLAMSVIYSMILVFVASSAAVPISIIV